MMDNIKYSVNVNVNGVEIKMVLNMLVYFFVMVFMIDVNNGIDVILDVMVLSSIVVTRASLSTTSVVMENVIKMDESGFVLFVMDMVI